MFQKYFDILKKSKLSKSSLIVLSIFFISVAPAEARVPLKKQVSVNARNNKSQAVRKTSTQRHRVSRASVVKKASLKRKIVPLAKKNTQPVKQTPQRFRRLKAVRRTTAPVKPAARRVVAASMKPVVTRAVAVPTKPATTRAVVVPVKPTATKVVAAPMKPVVTRAVAVPTKPAATRAVAVPTKPATTRAVAVPTKPAATRAVVAPVKPALKRKNAILVKAQARQQEAARLEALRVEQARQQEAARLEALRVAQARQQEAARLEALRVAQARQQEAARLEALRVEQARQQEAARLEALRVEQARQQEAARLETLRVEQARQQEAARLEALRVEQARQQEAARLAAIQAAAAAEQRRVQLAITRLRTAEQTYLRQSEERFARAPQEALNFLTRPFAKTEVLRMTGDSLDNTIGEFPLDSHICDLGYERNGPARTAQYMINLPTAPVFHPYDITKNTKGYNSPAFALNVRLPGYRANFGPPVLDQNLAGVNPEHIDTFLVVQDMPWYNAPGLLQLKPQYWLEPDAPYQDPVYRNDSFVVSAGVFSRQPGGPRIIAAHANNNALINPEQPENGLVENHRVSIHNTRANGVVTDPALISSGSSLKIGNLDLNVSQVLYSLVKHGQRAAMARHLLLNKADEEMFEQALPRSNNLAELKQDLENIKRAGVHFATIDMDEVFGL